MSSIDFARWTAIFRLREWESLTVQQRSSERLRRVAFTAGAAVIAKMISVGSALISVPLTLHYLGPERYGMWIVISSLVAMLSFADLGLGNGVLTVVADANGRNDRLAIRAFVSSGFFALLVVAFLILIFFFVAYPFFAWERIFNVKTPIAVAESGPALAVFVTCFALAVPLGIVQRVQLGLQLGFLSNVWQAMGNAIGLGGLLTAIFFRAGLPWLVFAFAGVPLFIALLNSLSFFGYFQRDIAPSWNAISRKSVTRIVRTGFLFLILQIVSSLAYSSDNFIIAQLLGSETVVDYSVPERMFSIITMVLAMALTPLWPAYGEAIARGDRSWVSRVLFRSIATSIALSAFLSLFLVLTGPSLVKLWVGNIMPPPLVLLIALGSWKVVEAGGNALAMFLNGANIVRLQIVVATATGIVAIALKIALMRRVGIVAAPLGSVISYCFVAIPLFSIYWLRKRTNGSV